MENPMTSRSTAIIIGAGFGGLSAAVELAAAGRSVTIYEAGPRVGGKADEVIVDGQNKAGDAV